MTPILSNTTIGHLRNRSRSGLLCVRVVNSSGETEGISCLTGIRSQGKMVSRALLRSFFGRERRPFPHHAAANFQVSNAVIRSWSHVLAIRTHCCSTCEASAHLSGQKLLTFQGIYHVPLPEGRQRHAVCVCRATRVGPAGAPGPRRARRCRSWCHAHGGPRPGRRPMRPPLLGVRSAWRGTTCPVAEPDGTTRVGVRLRPARRW